MFKTSKEFELAMYQFLQNILEGRVLPEELSFEIDEINYRDILDELIESNFVRGISYTRCDGNSIIVNKEHPRLSYRGLRYVESLQEFIK